MPILEGQIYQNPVSKQRVKVVDISKYPNLQKTIIQDLKTREQMTLNNEELLEYYVLVE